MDPDPEMDWMYNVAYGAKMTIITFIIAILGSWIVSFWL